MNGKIIGIVGPAGSGKSYLTRKLAKHYHGVPLYEGEDFPDRIKENWQRRDSEGLFEVLLWFRNQQVKKYLKACELKKKGRYVIMDTFWLTYQIYTPLYTKGFKRELASELAYLDRQTLTPPDVVIYLSPTEKVMKEYMKKRKRYWEKDEGFWKLMVRVKEEHEKFFEENKGMENLIIIDKSKVDFEKEEDFNELINKIDERIKLTS